MATALDSASGAQLPIQHSFRKEQKLRLGLEVRLHEGVIVIHCRGRISFGREASALSGRIAELMPRTRQLVLELSGVELIDSAGLGELVMVLMWAQACGCSLKIAAPRQDIHELLELTNLASALDIYPTLEEALLASRGQAA